MTTLAQFQARTASKQLTYRVQLGKDKQGNQLVDENGYALERKIQASSPFSALGIFTRRGANGLGSAWQLTRQSDGWIVCSNKNNKTIGGGYIKMKETNWDRNARYPYHV